MQNPFPSDLTITVERSRLPREVEPGLRAAEASDLGITPGRWPATIEVPDPDFPMTFHRIQRTWTHPLPNGDNRLGAHFAADGDLIAQDYATPLNGSILRVFND